MSHLNMTRKQMYFDKKAYSAHRHGVVTGWLIVIVALLFGLGMFITWLISSDEFSMLLFTVCGVFVVLGLIQVFRFTPRMNEQREVRDLIKELVDKLEAHHHRFSADDQTYVFFDGMIKATQREAGVWSIESTTEDGLPVLSFKAQYGRLSDGSPADGTLHSDYVTADVVQSIRKAIDAYENLADATEEAARMRAFMRSEKAELAKLVEF